MKQHNCRRSVTVHAFLVCMMFLIGFSCSKKPETVRELFPDLLVDAQALAKQFEVAAEGNNPLIDDLEDGDLSGYKAEGRNWSWSQFDDGSEGIQYLTIVQLEDAPGNGQSVLYVKGGDWEITGAGLSASLVNRVSPRFYGYYNATVYSGIEFWVKAVGLQKLRVDIGTPETTSLDEGGICMGNNIGHFTYSEAVSENWIQMRIPFSAFVLTNGKHSLTLDPSRIKGIHFSFETQVDYEVWLDEIAFYND